MHGQQCPSFCGLRVCIGVLPECLCHPGQEDCQVFIFFLCNLSDLIKIYRLHHAPFHSF